MENHKTLIILTPGFASSEEDTTCLPMQQHLVRTLNEMYPSLNIVILSFQYPYHHGVYHWYDNVVFSFNGRNRGGIQRLLLRRKINTILKELNRRSPITGLLSFWYGECAIAGKNFSDQFGIPHYCWILGQDAREENKYPRKVKLKANELIALSDFLQDEFETNHNVRPFMVVPPGIDSSPDKNQERDIDILGAGSLITLKRFDLFIDIISEMKKDNPAIKAVLAGDGPEKEKLLSMAHKSGLEFTGEIPHPDILKLMQRTKILMHTSSFEGFSGVCLEALNAGAHVISFTRAMRNDVNQWHIVGTKEEMVSKSLSILNDPFASYEPLKKYSMKDTAKKIMDLFIPVSNS